MKRAYQEKVLQNFSAIEKRTKLLKDVADGNRNDISVDQAKNIIGEIEHLIETSRSIVELVPTQ